VRIRQDKQTAARIREVAQSAAERIGSTVGPLAETQSAELRARLAPAVEQASAVARDRVERGLRAAAPRVESASQAMAPHVEKAVEKARERIVEDIVPRLAEAVAAAASAGAAAMHSAGDSAGERLQAVADKAEVAAGPKRTTKRRGRRVLLLGVLAAAAGAGLAAWRQRVKDTEDIWKDVPTAVSSAGRGSSNNTVGAPIADSKPSTDRVTPDDGATLDDAVAAAEAPGGEALAGPGSFGETAADSPAVGEGLETPPVEETPTPIDHEELTLDAPPDPPAEVTTKTTRARKAKAEVSDAAEAATDGSPTDSR
jgi:hypothetical protein